MSFLRPSVYDTDPLSEREQEILQLLADGLSNAEIGQRLSIALSTVKWYNTQIYNKLGATNRAEAIRQARLLGLFDAPVASKTQSTVVNYNLPNPATHFVGRIDELGELHDLIQNPDVRLVTVLAPGGMGKTRLALQVAQQQMVFFPDGVFFVPLAAIISPDLIGGAVMEALGYRLLTGDEERGSTNLAPFDENLRQRKSLIVLDNFEHVMAGANYVSDLLQSTQHLKILVTSRERLNLQGEHLLFLSGLKHPDDSHVESIRNNDAVRLFVQSARRIRPDFSLQDSDLGAIVRICELVEGMPLALELAASWIDVLTPNRIADEVAICQDILETEMRDIPERHRSVRAIFNHTWQSLSEREQFILMKLSIFRGGFTTTAAEEIMDADIRSLRRLVSKALIIPVTTDRYDMHELLRQYCEEKLIASEVWQDTLHRYSDYFMAMLGAIEPYAGLIQTVNQELRSNMENLLHAWQILINRNDFASLDRYHYAAMWFFSNSGWIMDAIQLYHQAEKAVLKAAETQPALKALHGKLLFSRYLMQYYIYDEPPPLDSMYQAIAAIEEDGHSPMLAWSYHVLASELLRVHRDDHEKIKSILQETWERLLAIGDEPVIISFMQIMCHQYWSIGLKDEHDRIANEAYQRAKALNKLGYSMFQCANQLGWIYFAREDYETSRCYWEESLENALHIGVISSVAHAYTMLCRVSIFLGDLPTAKSYMLKVIERHIAEARDWQILGALYGAYGQHYLLAQNRYEAATQIFAFVANHPLAVAGIRSASQYFLTETQKHLSPQDFERACQRGQGMTLNDHIQHALQELAT